MWDSSIINLLVRVVYTSRSGKGGILGPFRCTPLLWYPFANPILFRHKSTVTTKIIYHCVATMLIFETASLGWSANQSYQTWNASSFQPKLRTTTFINLDPTLLVIRSIRRRKNVLLNVPNQSHQCLSPLRTRHTFATFYHAAQICWKDGGVLRKFSGNRLTTRRLKLNSPPRPDLRILAFRPMLKLLQTTSRKLFRMSKQNSSVS